jgi:hypothetical protein
MVSPGPYSALVRSAGPVAAERRAGGLTVDEHPLIGLSGEVRQRQRGAGV